MAGRQVRQTVEAKDAARSTARRRYGVRDRFWLGSMFVVGLAAWASKADAQLVPTERETLMPPWSAQQVFEPTPLPLLSDPDTREDVAPEDTPVKGRSRPEYDPIGIRYGAWMFNPTLTAGTFYDSNIFSSNTNKVGDIAGEIGAGVRARSLWERHGIDLQAKVLSTDYAAHSGLNETDMSFKGSGHYDIDHATQLLAAFQAAYLHEGVGTLSSPAGAVQPTPYALLSSDLTLRHEFGRLTGSAGFRVDSYDYGSTVAQNGTPISQDSRDGQVYRAHARVDYTFSEKWAVFTAVEGNSRRLRGVPDESLSSDGYRALTGFDLQLTHLITAEIGGGYMSQRFDSDAIGTVQGPTYRAMLTWSPSRMLDVHFNAEQIVSEASDTSVTGILANTVQLGFDYEFRPNVVWSAVAAYERDDFKGQDRGDDVYAIDSRIKYLPNNIASISLWYRFISRQSNLPDFTYDKHQVGLDVAARF
jgi:hypothetical protein